MIRCLVSFARAWKPLFFFKQLNTTRAGDTIELLEALDGEEWWKGRVNGGPEGLFPSAYVKKVSQREKNIVQKAENRNILTRMSKKLFFLLFIIIRVSRAKRGDANSRGRARRDSLCSHRPCRHHQTHLHRAIPPLQTPVAREINNKHERNKRITRVPTTMKTSQSAARTR